MDSEVIIFYVHDHFSCEAISDAFGNTHGQLAAYLAPE